MHYQLSVSILGILLAAPVLPAQQDDALRQETLRLRSEVAALQSEKRRWESTASELREAMREVTARLDGVRDRGAGSVAGPFLAAPPPSSDTVGVAKVAVFAPRVEAEALRRRDIVFLKVRRVETNGVRLIADVELAADAPSVDLPIDESGGLYVVEWTTSDGNAFDLFLKDGASAQPAAVVHVKQLQSQGRFIFVGYRVE
jgi:hypothetical protein